jgi:hypothetical protein
MGTMALATRYLTVTQGNLNNNHLYLTEILDLFPADVIGGPRTELSARHNVLIICDHETIATDIVSDKNIFRQRSWLGRFFRNHRLQAGDQVRLEKLEPYLYRLSPVSREPATPLLGVPAPPVLVPAAARTNEEEEVPDETVSLLDHDPDRVDDAVLALLYLSVFYAPDGTRAGLAHPGDALERLQRKGFLTTIDGNTRSVRMTPEGLIHSEERFRTLFGRPAGPERQRRPPSP